MIYKKILYILVPIFLVGCKIHQNNIVYSQNEETLKDYISSLEKSSNWTFEIEGEKLSKQINNSELFQNNSIQTFQSVSTISNLCEPLLPSLKDFASLDLSSLDSIYFNFINNVCKKMINTVKLEINNFFEENYFFNYVFFVNDLKENWFKNFNHEFPKKIFSSYTIGKQIESFDIMQIPVRFYCEYGFVDLLFNINQNGKDIKIQKIDFIKWETDYGK